jgi:integrative and conjugative element protein (TIGR02256 family)
VSGRIVLFRREIWPLLEPFRQLQPDSPEAGGILLGYRRDPHIEITLSSTPGSKDVRRRFFFERLDECHQHLASTEWGHSDGYIDYLGEWHSHPEPHPHPSLLDLREWQHLGKTRKSRDPLILMIVGTDSCWAGIGALKEILNLSPLG